MSFNLKQELEKLNSTAPVIRDTDEAYSDDETRAKLDSVANEYEDELNVDSSTRRIRAPIGDLSEYGTRYKGKSVNRKDLDEDEEDEEDKEEEDDEEEGEDDEDEEEEGKEDEDEDEEEEEEETAPKVQHQKKNKSEHKVNIINLDRNAEIEKGKAVKNQLNFWDLLLDTRVKMQNMLNTANQYPQYDKFEEIRGKCDKDETIVNENQSLLVKAINQLAELQQRLVISDSEMSSLVKELGMIGNEESTNGSSSNNGSTKEEKQQKRKRSDDEDSEDDDEEEEEEDEDDEEIYSDTDEEMRANEAKKAKKSKQAANFNFTPLKNLDDLEPYLSKFNQEYLKYRNGTIQKWYDKTRLTTGKSFSALEKPILQQIEQILMDKERIIKRTQLKRTMLSIVGKEEDENDVKAEDEDKTKLMRDRHLKDYDAEIFDDQDFYNQLVRELIDRRAANVADPIELARKSIEMNRLRAKTSKKKVDTKASKGRKIRYNVHKPMVNFMAPIHRNKMSDETRNELFKSLFGNHVIVSTSKSNGHSSSDIDFSSIFKGFN